MTQSAASNRYMRGGFANSGEQQVPTGSSHLHPKQSEVRVTLVLTGWLADGLTDCLAKQANADGVDDVSLFGGRRTAFDVDIDMLEDKPWRKPGVDISDYFNYGFDEHSWRVRPSAAAVALWVKDRWM